MKTDAQRPLDVRHLRLADLVRKYGGVLRLNPGRHRYTISWTKRDRHGTHATCRTLDEVVEELREVVPDPELVKASGKRAPAGW